MFCGKMFIKLVNAKIGVNGIIALSLELKSLQGFFIQIWVTEVIARIFIRTIYPLSNNR